MLVYGDDEALGGAGRVYAMLPCCLCGRAFVCNPVRVPSIRDQATGRREGVCLGCMTRVNAARVKRGLVAHPIMPGAYEPTDEAELDQGVPDA